MTSPLPLPQNHKTVSLEGTPGSRVTSGRPQRGHELPEATAGVGGTAGTAEPGSARMQTCTSSSPHSLGSPPPPSPPPLSPSYLFLYNCSLRASRSLVNSLLYCKHREARSGEGRWKMQTDSSNRNDSQQHGLTWCQALYFFKALPSSCSHLVLIRTREGWKRQAESSNSWLAHRPGDSR